MNAARPELFIKTAIVILGGTLGIKAASSVMFRGFAAIIEAYLIYWAIVYFVARKWFGFSREWAAPLASGISICGVSAAIATAAAIRARPMAAVMVSSLVVIFAMVLPGINLITSGSAITMVALAGRSLVRTLANAAH
jgi:uncharacterized membrane protein YadS